jgi:hypothetical protein
MTWLNLFKECAAWFRDHPPFEIVYEPRVPEPKVEEIDFHKETVPLSFRIILVPSESGFQVLNGLLARLEKTGNREKWGFKGWPLRDIEPRDPAAVVFGGSRRFTFTVEAAILNEEGKTPGSSSITLTSGDIAYSPGEQAIDIPDIGEIRLFTIPNVNANDITPAMTIRITKVNGVAAETVGERGYVMIAGSKAAFDRYEYEEEQEKANLLALFDITNGKIIWYKGSGKDLVIPRTKFSRNRITGIREGVFRKRGLISVTIPRGVTSIGEDAFRDNQLTSVTIPQGVTSIRERAFAGNQLTSVTIPQGVTSIGEGAFSGNQLTSVIIPQGVTSIGDSAFRDNQLTSVTIPQGVTSIRADAFARNRLTSVTIPQGVTSIGERAFAGNQLTSVTIPQGVTSIRADAFAGNRLTSVTIPQGVTSIDEGAFAGNQLTSVTIPQGVTWIGERAFAGNQLTSVTIPQGVTRIGAKAFDENQLTRVTIGENVELGDVNLLYYYVDSFPYEFDFQYFQYGRRAGTYVYRNDRWKRQ